MRLACIYALLDSSNKIKSPHLEAALALWAYVEQSCTFIFGELKGDPSVDRALETLKRTERLTTTEIYSLFGRHTDRGEVERVIRELCKVEGITTEKTAGHRKGDLV